MACIYTKQFSESDNYIEGAYPIKAGVIVQDFYIFDADNIAKLDYEDKNVSIPSQIQAYLEKHNYRDISVELVSETETEIKYTAKFFDTEAFSKQEMK